MPNLITFWMFAPAKARAPPTPRAQTKAQRVTYPPSAKTFKAQFIASPAAVALPAPPLSATLLNAALNTGYGSTPAEMTGLGPPDWKSLQSYLKARLGMMLSTLDETLTPPDVRLSPILEVLESSEKLHMAYLLGSVMCRVATDAWATAHNPPLQVNRFWHWKVARDAAVNLDSKVQKGKGKVSNPDFIFQLSNGSWFAAEAKGSYGGESWTELSSGLEQASKFSRIAFYDLAAHQVVRSSMKGFTCTLAHFKKGQLQVAHVDPPIDAGGNDAPQSNQNGIPEWPPLILAVIADLVCFEQALSQFENLTLHSYTTQPGWAEDQLAEVNWRVLRESEQEGDRLYIGLPTQIQVLSRPLRIVLRALRRIIPVIGEGLRFDGSKPSVQSMSGLRAGVRAELTEAVVSDALAAKANGDRPGASAAVMVEQWWSALDRVFAAEYATWDEVLQEVVKVDAWPTTLPGGLLGLGKTLEHVATRTKRYLRLKTRLGKKNEETRSLEIQGTDQGLLIATGNWRPAMSRRQKLVKL